MNMFFITIFAAVIITWTIVGLFWLTKLEIRYGLSPDKFFVLFLLLSGPLVWVGIFGLIIHYTIVNLIVSLKKLVCNF
jgi:uncharacterized membrane protein